MLDCFWADVSTDGRRALWHNTGRPGPGELVAFASSSPDAKSWTGKLCCHIATS
jgi:hypothetical protein